MPYRVLEHIAVADTAFEATGTTLEELFRAAAEALLAVMVEEPEKVLSHARLDFTVLNDDYEMLLFDFLQELIFFKDARRLMLHAEEVRISETPEGIKAEVACGGEEIDTQRHSMVVDVKAVTMHRFSLEESDDGWRATVVLDV